MTKQEAAIKYITENYLDFNRLRHDIVADKLQIRMADSLEDAALSGYSLEFKGGEYWREMTKHDINSIVCHAAQEYDANITSREVMTALQSDLIPDVHPLREYVLSCGEWTKEQPDWIDFVARQVRVKNNDDKVSGNNNDNTDNLRPNQYPLGAQGEDKNQQPKQQITNNIPLTNTASGEEYDLNDNIDNLRPNQYPLGAQGEDKNQQPIQLDPTTCSARNNTASGEGYDLNDNNDNLRPNQYPLGAQGEDKNQQPKQQITNNIPLTNTASGEEYDLNDNIDNLRPNQYPLGAQGEDKNQQPIQLDPTTCSARNNTASGEGNNTTPSYTTLPHTTPSADALWRVCFKKWFVAMVASWMKDEVVNHQVLVLIGKQGIFKTTWLEHLIPPHLRAYACKLANSNDLNKDERLRITEFGLISLDEIDSMNNRELNQLKSVITATDVNERAAYAYTKERRVRLASFCASGNRRDFLTDITGNRRWLPFEVEEIQNPFYTLLPYERMYAQAWALAQDPLFSYWFDLDEIEVLEEHNQHFRDESNEEQLLPILFDVPAEGRGEFMTTAQISERLVTYGNIKKPMALSRLGMVLGAAGYQSTRPKIGGRLIRGWLVYQRDTDEIASLKRLLKE